MLLCEQRAMGVKETRSGFSDEDTSEMVLNVLDAKFLGSFQILGREFGQDICQV